MVNVVFLPYFEVCFVGFYTGFCSVFCKGSLECFLVFLGIL